IGGVLARLPSSVSVLAIENSGDIVPELDTRLNPDLGNITTVTVHHNHADLGANHDLAKSYLPGAEQVDSSADPSVRAYLDGARNFLDAGAITTQAFAITRTFH
ncbi:MAG TPA: hypothetical protein VK816_10670, partial [Jatrophihabitantaceae bacterium]|nr:hypothetical protein [Jatrophihabitantaceae bacterium]